MNLGFVAGRVFQPDGKTLVRRGSAAIIRIVGEQPVGFSGAGNRPNYSEASIDSDGKYAVPFAWSGAEFAQGMLPVTIYLYADMQAVPTRTQPFTVLAHARITTPGYILVNVSARFGLSTPDLQSIPGLLSFTKDLIEAYRKIKAVPLPTVDWTSAEGWMLVGAADIVLE